MSARAQRPTTALSRRRSPRRRAAVALAALTALASLAACDGTTSDVGAPEAGAESAGQTEKPAPVRLDLNVPGKGAVPVDHELEVGVRNAELRKVSVTGPEGGALAGRMKGGAWQASGRLEPGLRYQVTATTVRPDGEKVTRTSSFRTEDLTLDEQTYASVAPLAGETVGVGMPVIVIFDVPVTDKAAFERHMTVTSEPQQPGTWHWVSDNEVHWRPKTYWQAGSHVTVDVDVNSIPAGNGVYGQESRTVEFDVGDSVVSKVNVDTHQMQVFVNGDLARTVPVSAGKKGWETRSGTKVIVEKFRRKRMNAATIGVDKDDPEYYNLSNVQYAMRVTYSGEFLHGAPWSVGSQGSANVSHGCVGMSLEDAAWLYNITKRGDVVEVTGSDRYMTLYNGYGDWNASFSEYAEGSALS